MSLTNNKSASSYLFPTENACNLQKGIDYRFGSSIRKVQEEDFTGPMPQNGTLLLMMFALPESKYDKIDLNDKTTRKALNKIRTECKVYVQVRDTFIQICGRQPVHIKNGVQALRDFLLANTRGLTRKMIPLVHRGTNVSGSILLKPTEDLQYTHFSGAWRGVADAKDPTTDDGVVPLTSQVFLQAIHQVAQIIRPVPGELRMRVHLGILSLTQKKKADKYSMTQEFKKLLEDVADRGTVYVHHKLGDAQRSLDLREHIYAMDNTLDPFEQRFQAAQATILYLRDVKPTYCLVFFSGNRRIEVDVQYDPDPALPNLCPTAANPRIYESCKKLSAAEIAVACPDKKYDWHLIVESDTAAEGKDAAEILVMNTLAKDLEFSRPPEDSFEFPVFTASRALLGAAKIDNVSCKVSWTFEYIRKPYFVEISVYHDWGQVVNYKSGKSLRIRFDTAGHPQPVKSCGIALYGREWDEKMHAMDPASGRFYRDFRKLFGNHGSHADVDGLLEEVDYLLDTLT